MKRAKVESIGEKGNFVKVKKRRIPGGFVWIAGLKITSDGKSFSITMPCGNGGFFEKSRSLAIYAAANYALQSLPSEDFEKAKKIFNNIMNEVKNRSNKE